MPEILTFKSTISKEGLELTSVVSDAILQVEELLRKIEEVKEFTYKGYDIHEFNSNCDMLLIKFSIQWRGEQKIKSVISQTINRPMNRQKSFTYDRQTENNRKDR